MRTQVRASFWKVSAPWEGVTTFLYLDIYGWVTTGVGNLMPRDLALTLPWLRPDGSPASKAEVGAAWDLVYGLRDKLDAKGRKLVLLGGGTFAPYTTLRLSPAAVERLVMGKLDEVDRQLTKRFPGYTTWPADAQLATISLAWACGAGFRYPKLEAHLRALRFAEYACDPKTGEPVLVSGAAFECHIDEKGPDRVAGTSDDNRGLRPRNAANKVMYANAARVLADALDPDELYFPRVLRAA